MTQREGLESGRLGDFNERLLEAAESGDVWALVEVFGRADETNRARLEQVFPEGFHICQVLYNEWPCRGGWLGALARQFPRLRDLDGPVRFAADT